MEVILREHVDNLGKRGEVVKVADGYARNYLLPRKLALLATEGNKKQIEREREKFEAKEGEERKVAEAMAGRMGSLEIQIARRVGENDVLFGSVTSADVANALDAKGFEVDRAAQAASRRRRHREGQGRGGRHADEVRTKKLELGSSELEVECGSQF
jgi:large subunit ribosomal protein L9